METGKRSRRRSSVPSYPPWYLKGLPAHLVPRSPPIHTIGHVVLPGADDGVHPKGVMVLADVRAGLWYLGRGELTDAGVLFDPCGRWSVLGVGGNGVDDGQAMEDLG